MDFSTRYTKRQGAAPQVQAVIDAKVIGLLINPEFEFEPEPDPPKTIKRPKIEKILDPNVDVPIFSLDDLQKRIATGNVKTIRLQDELGADEYAEHKRRTSRLSNPKKPNHGFFKPCGPLGEKIFLHGRRIFTPEAAKKYYEDGERSASLFSEEVIEQVQQVLLPDACWYRASDYERRQIPDRLTSTKISMLELIKEHPEIDFSSVPAITDRSTLYAALNKVFEIAAQNGIDVLAEIEKEGEAGPERGLKLLAEEVPQQLNAYLSEDPINSAEQSAKAQWGQQLEPYMAAHQWDWQIIDNFRAAAQAGAEAADLVGLLHAGARLRAIDALGAIAEAMHNPYDAKFVEVEAAMARMLVDSVQSKALTHCLRGNTAFLLTNSMTLGPYNKEFGGILADAAGKYLDCKPANPHFHDFVMMADGGLNYEGLAWIARHEVDHKLDLDNGMLFQARYKDSLGDMIAGDVSNLRKTRAFVKSISQESPQADIDALYKLARKRGWRPADMTLSQIKHDLDYTLSGVESDIAVFAREVNGSKIYDTGAYGSDLSKGFEIPAFMEHLKGRYGRTFMSAVMPALSRATDQHRAMVLDSPAATPER